MTPEQVQGLIILARRAPLQNLAEAEAASRLLQEFSQYFEALWAAQKLTKDRADKKPSNKPAPEATQKA